MQLKEFVGFPCYSPISNEFQLIEQQLCDCYVHFNATGQRIDLNQVTSSRAGKVKLHSNDAVLI